MFKALCDAPGLCPGHIFSLPYICFLFSSTHHILPLSFLASQRLMSLEDILSLGSRHAASSSRKLRRPSRCGFMVFTPLRKRFLSGLSTFPLCILLARVSIFFHLAAAYIFYFSNFLGFPQELLSTCCSLPPAPQVPSHKLEADCI